MRSNMDRFGGVKTWHLTIASSAVCFVLPLAIACTAEPLSMSSEASGESGIAGDAEGGMHTPPGAGVRRDDPTIEESAGTSSGPGGTSSFTATSGQAATSDGDDASGEPSVRFDVEAMTDISLEPMPVECDGLIATVRDMQGSHPDFETYTGTRAYEELVLPELGADDTPVVNPDYDGPDMITSEASFFDWYHDVDGVNEAFSIELALADDGNGLFVFDSDAFFPLDDMGFGNEGRSHNFHFTTEVHTSFTYSGGEIFTFRGDDDVWMFVDGQLVIDLGGLHSVLSATADMDTLGLTVGETYSMDIFHAERHTTESNFRIETTIDCFVAPGPEG